MNTLLLLLACASAPAPTSALDGSAPVGASRDATAADAPPNILVVVADDFGAEAMSCYRGFGVEQAPQPTMAALCRRGVVFDQAWSNPMCSPSRASMLTGRDAWRLGIGEPTGGTAPGLSSDELALPAALTLLGTGHASAAFGKWHLADDDNGGNAHPNLAGFDHFSGAMRGEVEDFYEWTKVVNGEEFTSTNYATTDTVDDALEWIGDQEGPWFAWVAFHAPHWPLHAPPDDLHSFDLEGTDKDIDESPVPYFLAMVEAMDAELGRLLAGIPPAERARTWVVILGDNGTWHVVNQGLFDATRSKGSLYQGGVRVPLVIAGPEVAAPGRREDAMVSLTDVFATVVELAGGDPAALADEGVELDSVSAVPYLEDAAAEDQRDWITAAVYGPTTRDSFAGQAVFDGRHKLIRLLNGDEELYDLAADPRESRDLLTAVSTSTYGGGGSTVYEDLGDLIDAMPIDEFWD